MIGRQNTWPRPPSNLTLPPTPQTTPLRRSPGMANLQDSSITSTSDQAHTYHNDTGSSGRRSSRENPAYENDRFPSRQAGRPSFVFGSARSPSSGRDTLDAQSPAAGVQRKSGVGMVQPTVGHGDLERIKYSTLGPGGVLVFPPKPESGDIRSSSAGTTILTPR